MDRPLSASRGWRTFSTAAVSALCVLLSIALTRADDPEEDDRGDRVLYYMFGRSESVLHVKVLEVAGGECTETNVERWSAK